VIRGPPPGFTTGALVRRKWTSDNVAAFRAKKERMRAEEPPSMRAAVALAYNVAVNAMYAEPEASDHRLIVPPWLRRLLRIVSFRSATYAPPATETKRRQTFVLTEVVEMERFLLVLGLVLTIVGAAIAATNVIVSDATAT
jgi:hypothetical protein